MFAGGGGVAADNFQRAAAVAGSVGHTKLDGLVAVAVAVKRGELLKRCTAVTVGLVSFAMLQSGIDRPMG